MCEGINLTRVLSLAPTPPANSYVSEAEVHNEDPLYPLEVFFCEGCAHVQLLDVLDPTETFESYVYVSGTTKSFVQHFEDYAREVITEFSIPENSLVVDIGSNDGTLLSFFKEEGMRVVGVDPAREIASLATGNGIPTVAAFFDADVAIELRRNHGSATVITANNVFAHIDDLSHVIHATADLLEPTGILVFEVSYLLDVYEKTLFDTIYHEHLDYHSVTALVPFLERHGLELVAARRVSSHGGSLRAIAQLKGGPRSDDGSVRALAQAEKERGLDSASTFIEFGARIDLIGKALRECLDGFAAKGSVIAGYGAPAKATTLLHHFDIGHYLACIIDDSPWKQGLYSPGHHIPIVSPNVMSENPPDCLLVLAWNFADAIIERFEGFKEGGHFIVPLPEVRVQ